LINGKSIGNESLFSALRSFYTNRALKSKMGFYCVDLDLTMLSIDRVQKLLDDESTTAEEAEEIRDVCREMAEILYEKFIHERGAGIDVNNKQK